MKRHSWYSESTRGLRSSVPEILTKTRYLAFYKAPVKVVGKKLTMDFSKDTKELLIK